VVTTITALLCLAMHK